MTLQIRDPRAHDLARHLAAARNLTMTEAVIQALEGELRRDAQRRPLGERVRRIAAELHARRHPAVPAERGSADGVADDRR